MKRILKQFLPPILLHLYSSLTKSKEAPNEEDSLTWLGNFPSWEEAQKQSIGYSNQAILNKCRNALLLVKNGEAVYERDSVIFDTIQHAWPVLACLENVAISNDNKLAVIDFGGSLGSSYFQNRHYLQIVRSLKWIVVEQDHFVSCGKQEFEDEFLKFAFSITDALGHGQAHCLFLSGVLQYLDDPYKWLREFMSFDIEYLLFDRTSFIEDVQRLTVQNVPEEIYKATYPCWFLNEGDFLKAIQEKYELIADFPGFADRDIASEDGKRMYWKGFFFKRKK